MKHRPVSKKKLKKFIIAILYTAECCDEPHVFIEAVAARSSNAALDWGRGQLADLDPTIVDESFLTISPKFKFKRVK